MTVIKNEITHKDFIINPRIDTSNFSKSDEPWLDGCSIVGPRPQRRWVEPRRFWERQRVASNFTICPTLAFNLAFTAESYVVIGDTKGVYYHLHKVGGTTLRFSNFRQGSSHLSSRKFGERDFDEQAENLLQKVVDTPRSFLFTFVRDPVTRFLSGVGQLLRMPRKRLFQPCLTISSNTEELLDCVLSLMERSLNQDKLGFNESSSGARRQGLNADVTLNFLDEHLVPQSMALLKAVKGSYLPVMVMPLQEMNVFLQLCTTSQPKKRRSKSHTKAGKFLIHEGALTPSLIARICRVYSWDVEFLDKELHGLVSTPCNIITLT